LLPTAAIGLILFIVLGSANTVNMVFSLNISLNQLIVLAISFLVYLFTVDSIVEIAVKHILGQNTFYYSVILLIRIGVFYMIGELVDLTQTVSVTFSTGMAFIILLIEILYNLREKHKVKKMDEFYITIGRVCLTILFNYRVRLFNTVIDFSGGEIVYFFDWKIEMPEDLKPYIDTENKRMAILTVEDDEIHIALEFDENSNLVMHPRWNINIVILGDKHLRFTTNS